MAFERVDLSDSVTLYRGDCLEVMQTLADGSVDFIFADPPYGHNNNGGKDLASRRERALGIAKDDDTELHKPAELPCAAAGFLLYCHKMLYIICYN